MSPNKPSEKPARARGRNEDDQPDEYEGSRAASLRAEASETIKECFGRWSELRTAGGLALGKYFDRSFQYVEGILGDKTSPTDWVKDGVALLVGYYSATRDIYDALYELSPSASRRPASKETD